MARRLADLRAPLSAEAHARSRQGTAAILVDLGRQDCTDRFDLL
jgi:hypothetical protein